MIRTTVAVRPLGEARGPCLARFAADTEAEARRQAYRYCRNTRTRGFRIDLEERLSE